MGSILEALYQGRLQPDEAIMPVHPEYRALNRNIASLMEQWKKRLGEEAFRELEDLFDLSAQSSGMHAEAAFYHGFNLGATLLVEVMMAREQFSFTHETK
ncbi:DUF6809 family protein [Paenibacillus terreus]|uniref:DUF6809 family protein n=1 Tax=Paenibacillus terreus TaxID=1387834 RepID=A0ABV5BFX3_9BACL